MSSRAIILGLIVYIVINCNPCWAMSCEDIFKRKHEDTQEFFDLSKSANRLVENFGIEVDLYARHLKSSGSWNGRTLRVNPDMPTSIKGSFAHETVHVITDIKIKNDPSLKNLSRAIQFKALRGQSIEDLVDPSLKVEYSDYFRRDEIHAFKKQGRIQEALAKHAEKEGYVVDIVMESAESKIAHRKSSNFAQVSRDLLEIVYQFISTQRYMETDLIFWQPSKFRKDVISVTLFIKNNEGDTLFYLEVPVVASIDFRQDQTFVKQAVNEVIVEAMKDTSTKIRELENYVPVSFEELWSPEK